MWVDVGQSFSEKKHFCKKLLEHFVLFRLLVCANHKTFMYHDISFRPVWQCWKMDKGAPPNVFFRTLPTSLPCISSRSI